MGHADPGGWPGREPDLMLQVRRALRADHPLGLLELASSLLAVVDPRTGNPFDRGRLRSGPSREELLRTFLEIDRVETSALLAAVVGLGVDEVEQRRIGRVLDGRGDALPPWLLEMSEAKAYRTVEMSHILGDGDNVMVGVAFPTGQELAAVVYIDHNLGTVAKDAFVVPDSIAGLLDVIRSKTDDADTSLADIPPDDAKARIVDAIATGAITIPPFETDTWPSCRPLVEWIVGLLPDGGHGYERPEWGDDDRQRLVDRFFASSLGTGLDDPDHRDLLSTIVWLGCDYGPGDPMLWSTVAVELLLVDRMARKVVAPPSYLAKAPDLLRAFIRFCHDERGISATLTDEALDAVDRWEPEYQAAIRSPRLHGPAALFAAVDALDPDAQWSSLAAELGLPDYGTAVIERLRHAVGGKEALDALDDAPLPDEPFDWSGIPDDVHDRVAEALELCDRCCDELLDVEYRTATRRVLARIARNGPEVFRRRGRSDTAAAAICWSVGTVNDLFSASRGRLSQKALLAHFGVQGSISSRAHTLLAAGGFPRPMGGLTLGSADYLVSRRRRRIIDTRARHAPG